MSTHVVESTTDSHYPGVVPTLRFFRTTSDIIVERDRRDFEASSKAQAERLYWRNSWANSAEL